MKSSLLGNWNMEENEAVRNYLSIRTTMWYWILDFFVRNQEAK
jgi:hypothetical protein